MKALTAGQRHDRRLLWALIALLAWAPLPPGSNRPIPWTGLALATAVLLIAWSARAAFGPARPMVTPDRLWPALAGFVLVLVVIDVQMLPFLPRTLHHPVWLEASAVLRDTARGRISADPHATDPPETTTTKLLLHHLLGHDPADAQSRPASTPFPDPPGAAKGGDLDQEGLQMEEARERPSGHAQLSVSFRVWVSAFQTTLAQSLPQPQPRIVG
jgi:hypothetical protein